MVYDYAKERQFVFTDEGQRTFLKIRDQAKRLFAKSKFVQMGDLIENITGDSWESLACVDRLVEIGELTEVKLQEPVAGQHRLFRKTSPEVYKE